MKYLITLTLALVVLVSCVSDAHCARRRRGGGPAVRKILVVGADHFSEKEIRDIMRTKQSKFLRTKRLRESTLEADLISIEAFYERNGFLDAEASIDELRYDEERDNVWIRILISEGLQTRVKDVVLEGNESIESEVLRRALGTKVGEPLNKQQIGGDKYRLYSLYADRGFVFARVSHEVEGTDGEAVVRYILQEGVPAGIGEITVRGNNRVRDRIITREVTLKSGDTFSGRKVVDSQQKILDTDLFKDVEIEPKASEVDSASVDLLVKVKERKMREVSLRVGYGTREEAKITVGWLHRNLWNSGRQFEVRSMLGSKDFDKGLTRSRGDLALTDRWLLGRRLAGAVAVFAEETLEEYKEVSDGEYTLDRLGVNLSVKKDILRVTKVTLGYTHEVVNVRKANWEPDEGEDLRLEVGHELNRSATMVVERDTRRPFFDPLGGSLTRLAARRAGGIFGGDNSYNRITWSWSRYMGFRAGSVIAVSTRIGFADAFGDSKEKGVPEYDRFRAGGSSTIRGYDEQEFGPGDFLLLANVELRFPIFWKLGGVVFFDMGNAWPSINDVKKSDFDLVVPSEEYELRRSTDAKYSAGLGLGIQTPVGPVRVDYGLRLKRGIDAEGNKESPGRLHLTVGHAF